MSHLSHFKSRFQDKTAKVGVVGLGYVGLPLVLGFTNRGHRVLGLDIDPSKIEAIHAGKSYLDHIPAESIAAGVNSGLLEATQDFSRADECDALILCVPTPLDRHLEPDLSYITQTMESLLPYLRSGQLVSLESTTWPGTTEEVLRPMIEAKGLVIGQDVFLCFSPEREDPGNKKFTSVQIPKVIGGSTPACLEAGLACYREAIQTMVPVSSTRVAEFAKLLENIHRAVNIGLVNELKVAADAMGIDIWEVIEAASTKPFGFTPYYPGPGLGGHCIPIDPFYLTWKAREFGVHTHFIELAGQINRSMPDFVVRKVMEALNDHQKSVKGSKVLLLGLAYKPDVNDMRESPTFELMERLDQLGAKVDYLDPHIPVITPTREHARWTGCRSVDDSAETLASYDAVVLATNHAAFDLKRIAANCPVIVDTRNAFSHIPVAAGQVIKA